MRIYNSSRTLVYEDRIKSDGGFRRPYDLKDLEAGVYFFEIQDEDSKIILQVLHGNNKLRVGLRKIDPDRVRLTVAESEFKKLTVRISDDKDNTIHTEVLPSEGGFSKVYNLAQVDAASVIIRVLEDGVTIGSLSY